MKVRIVSSSTGEVRAGWASLSAGRGKRTVYVLFNDPIEVPLPEPGMAVQSRAEEFYLSDFERAICVSGQGTEFPNHAWHLHENDARKIVAEGGG